MFSPLAKVSKTKSKSTKSANLLKKKQKAALEESGFPAARNSAAHTDAPAPKSNAIGSKAKC